ncbi:protein-L-isoaspartate O-methyltransferase family protein [Palleronia sp. KMU-117]|uniref:protein-L-isoaspartate O-methyltransferase family protein n=1 Tax=Palleronia sp. KMU-117 TaxID=3434108 RepID=UPI003D736DE8
MSDYETRRITMVDTQVRPSDVTKFPIIDAMLTVPRELFVPQGLREAAYAGRNLDVRPGRVLLEPRTLAKLLDALDIEPDDLVLDIGPWLGYSAAVIARLAEAVVAVEDDAGRVADAEALLAEIGADNVAMIEGPLDGGAPKHGPYDAIVLEGAVESVPEAIIDQLKDGGRIGAIFMEGALGVARVGHKSGGRLSWRYAFNAAAPTLPGFEAARDFVF